VVGLASVALQHWGLPKVQSATQFVVVSLGATACMLYCLIAGARLCEQGADTLGREPTLPTATVVPS